MADMSAKAVIEDGVIVIRVPLANLQTAIDGAHSLGYIHERQKITDLDEYGPELCNELNQEDEQGTTLIHRCFDKAFNETLEQGAFGIETHPEQDF